MRRSRLRTILDGLPVDAMNPRPDIESIDGLYINYYKDWSWWQAENRMPFFMMPSVAVKSEGFPEGFHGQQYRVPDEELDAPVLNHLQMPIVDISINLNAKDNAIRRDFNTVLRSLRNSYSEEPVVRPRHRSWVDMHILQVWDLRQFRVSPVTIMDLFDRFRNNAGDRIQPVRNSFNTALHYIDEGHWLELAYNLTQE